MLKKAYYILIAFLLNARLVFATPEPDYNVDKWTNSNDKLGGAIWFVGQGAKVVGVFALVFGFYQFGMSFSSDDPGNRNKALLFLACGLILFWTPDILTLFMRWNIIDPTKW